MNIVTTKPTLPAGEPIVLTTLDPTTKPAIEGEYDERVPGSFVNGKIVVEQVSPTNETTSTTVVSTSKEVERSGLLGYSNEPELEYGEITLSAGVYRFYPEGHPERAVMRVVGDPKSLTRTYAENLRDKSGELTERAKWIRNKTQNNVFGTKTVQTNSTGHWSVSVPSSTLVVGATAYKIPEAMDGSSANISEVRDWYALTNSTASMHLSTSPERTDVPASNVTIETREVSAPPFVGINTRAEMREQFQQWLSNLSYSELPPALQQHSPSKETLVSTYNQLWGIVQSNPALEDSVLSMAEKQGVEVELTSPDDVSKAKLQSANSLIRQALAESRLTLGSSGGSSSVGEHTVSMTRVFPVDDLQPEQVMVTAHYTNGTSAVFGPSNSSFVSIEHRVGNDAVVVENFDFGKAAGGTINIRVASSEGVGSASKRFTDPDFSGDRPSLEAIDFNTLAPSVGDELKMELEPGDDTAITSIQNVTVYGPSGSTVSSSITDARTVSATPTTAGVHYVEVKFKANSHTWTLTQRVKVVDQNHDMPPSIRTTSTPYGQVALVGDDYTSASLDVQQGGSKVVSTAVLPEKAELPTQSTHIYLAGMSMPPSSEVTVQIVRGEQRTGVSEHLGVTMHLPAMPDDGRQTYYRNGEPVPSSGNPKMEMNRTAGQLIVETYSDGTGEVTVKTDASPSSTEYWLEYWLDLQVPDANGNN